MAVTYTFSTQSGSIPLAQLDANFATPITIGNTSVQLGNTITTLNNITLANTTISSGNVTLTNVSVTTANVTTANITNAVIGTANVTTANITSGVITTANITTGNVGTLTLTNALGTTSGGTGLTSFTSGGVVYASSSSALATGSALTFDGTNLGIGTSSPSAKLTVNDTNGIPLRLGDISAAPVNQTAVYVGAATGALSGAVNGDLVLIPRTSTTASITFWTGSTTAAERMRLDSSGNLGIGTSSPATRLDVSYTAAAGDIVHIAGANSVNGYIGAHALSNGGLYINSNQANQDLRLQTQGTDRVILDSSGNLGIGTSSPSFKLDVAGGVARLQQGFQVLDTDGYFAFANKTVGATGNYGFYYSGSTSSVQIWTASSQRVTIDSSGNLTVPAMYSTTVTTPRNVFIDSTGKMGGISSSRASKTNISQLDTADWIYELNPVTFNYLKKDEEGEYLEEFEEELQFGLIAEEVELVKPELCIYTDDKVSGIHYDRMIAPLIKAIQELKASNDALTARIAQLEAK